MTTTRTLLLSPIDAWFFRDGRPYNESESNQTDVVSLFPPPATTLVGAIRAGLARSKDWNGQGKWSQELNATLGDGFEGETALGTLSFRGPWLRRARQGAEPELFFPMPLHVLGKSLEHRGDDEPSWQPGALLTPGAPLECDLGQAVRLPVRSEVCDRSVESNKLKEPAGVWVTAAGLEKVLRGELPAVGEAVKDSQLWRHEARIGLKRDETKRTTLEGALYSPRFVRLANGVSLVMTVSGLPVDWHVPQLLTLGGEGRMADCQTVSKLTSPDFEPHTGRSSKQVTVTLLTPMLPPDDGRGGITTPQPHQQFFDWPGTKVVSACVGKRQAVGGWDSTNKRPLPLRPVLPAGSTWFLEVDDPQVIAQHAARGVGLKTKYGFGQVALGNWPASKGDSPQ